MFEGSLIYDEFIDITKKSPGFKNTFTFKLKNKENVFYQSVGYIGHTVSRDYINKYTDFYSVTLCYTLGVVKTILDNKDYLEMIVEKQIFDLSTNTMIESKIQSFNAYILNKDLTSVEKNVYENNDQNSLDIKGFINMEFQLMSKTVDILRTVQFGNAYNNVKIDSLLTAVITEKTKIPGIDNRETITGVDIIDVDNKQVYKNLIIPHQTKLVDLPNTMQNKYGIYNSGTGFYIFDKVCYIYNLYSSLKKRVGEDIIIYLTPKKRLFGVDRTYSIKDGVIKILINSESDTIDISKITKVNNGDGARITNVEKIFNEDSNTVKNNKAYISKTNANSEFSTDKNIRYSPIPNDHLSTNKFKHYSAITLSSGTILTVQWNHCDIDVLKPACRLQIVYYENEKIKKVSGILLSIEQVSMNMGGLNDPNINSSSVMNIYIEK